MADSPRLDPAYQQLYSDVYVGLRATGYSIIGGIRALRVLGLSLGEAKGIADACEVMTGGTPLFGGR